MEPPPRPGNSLLSITLTSGLAALSSRPVPLQSSPRLPVPPSEPRRAVCAAQPCLPVYLGAGSVDFPLRRPHLHTSSFFYGTRSQLCPYTATF